MLIDCPKCHKEICSRDATCAHCGATINPAKQTEFSPLGVGCAALLAIPFLFFLLSSDSDNDPESSSPPKPAHSPSGAWRMCKVFVEKGLKAPATADFPWYSENYVTKLGGAKYRVESYVDAQNSFGAQLRTNFSCTAKWIGGSNWQQEEMSFD